MQLCVLLLRCGHRGGVLAPLLAAAAALWQPPAAKDGQGDCDFPLGPPWILLLPLETPPLRYGVGGDRAECSGAALCLVTRGGDVALRFFYCPAY